ncbi:MAG: hypothetical protein U0002_07460 [Thermoanaerobaculia bacterium]
MLLMLFAWVSAGWLPASASEAQAGQSPAEPEFQPGIPGLKMADVRDHEHLWAEFEELQRWEHGDRISIAEFRTQAIEKTSVFLGLTGPAQESFQSWAASAVKRIRGSFHADRQSDHDPSVASSQFSQDLAAAVSEGDAALGDSPRSQLFAKRLKEWLLRLAFGPTEAKEAREARSALGSSPAQ